jgi:nucleoside phosphorylase
MHRSVILFVAANPTRTNVRTLDQECAAIESELRMTPGRDDFEFRSKWAVTVDGLMRHLLELQPAVVHVSGHGDAQGLLLEDEHGRPRLVTAAALTRMIKAVGTVRVVVLAACFSDMQAEALREVVDCTIGMTGAITDDAARAFAVGFYRALGYRRSIGNAYEHAVAALEGVGLTAQAVPRCLARARVEVETLVLRGDMQRPAAASIARPSTDDEGSEYRGKIDVGILTIREDENAAVLRRFDKVTTDDRRRRYRIRRLALPGGDAYTIAVLRCLEQGNRDAQAAAHALLEDLAPRFVLVVGIAGGVPSHEFTLGDVVVSSRIADFSVEAVIRDRGTEYALGGGPLHPRAATLAADLGAAIADGELDGWSSPDAITQQRPAVDLADHRFYGHDDWKRSVRNKLRRQLADGPPRPPLAIAGAIASSDRLVKDDEILAVWLKVARQVVAVEMESAGIYQATHERNVPFLAIRGISDIVGFERDPAWTAYACHSAAAFARAWLCTRPFEPLA